MKKFLKFGILLAIAMVLFTGCRTSPIITIENSTFVPTDTSKGTLENVGRSIIRAGATLGWKMEKVKEDEIMGTLYLRDHMAKVRIPYTLTDYSILYDGSSNLKYDAKNRTIHSNYNGWIENLNNAIQIQLGMF